MIERHLRLTLVLAFLAIGSRVHAQGTSFVEQWSIEAEDSEFVAPESIAVTASCQVWVADPRSGLWRFGCDDPIPTPVSRSGGGPAEFRALTHVTATDDRKQVVLWDHVLQRASIFSEAGKFESLQTLRLPEGPFGRLLDLTMTRRDSVALVWTSVHPRMGNERPRQSFVFSIGRNGAVRDSLAVLGGFESIRMQARMGEGTLDSRFDAPLQRRPFVVFLPDGGFVTGSNDGPSLTRYTPSGRAMGTIPLPIPRPGRVTSRDRSAYMDSIRQSAERELEGTRSNETFRKAFWKAFEGGIDRAVRYPETRQWYDHLILDDTAQFLWVQLPRHDESYARTWLEVGVADGAPRRSITVPHKGAVVAAAVVGDSLIAIERSKDAFPRIARYGRIH